MDELKTRVYKYYDTINLKDIRSDFKLLIWFIDTKAGRDFAEDLKGACKKGSINCKTIFDFEKEMLRSNERDLLEALDVYKPKAIFVNNLTLNKLPFEVPENLAVFTWLDCFFEPMLLMGEKNIRTVSNNNILCCPFMTYDDKISKKLLGNIKYKNNVVNFPFTASEHRFKKYQLNEEEMKKYGSDLAIVVSHREVGVLYSVFGLNDNFLNSTIGEKVKKFIDIVWEECYKRMKENEKPIDSLDMCKEMVEIGLNATGLKQYNFFNDELMEMWAKIVLYFIATYVSIEVLVEWLQERKYDLKIWGQGWDKISSLKDYAMGEIQDDVELAKVYQSTKIVVDINFILSIHRRTFESILSGGFILIGKRSVGNELDFSRFDLFFEENKDIATYCSKKELYDKIDFFLNNEQERQNMRERALKVIQDNNLYAEEVLKKVVEQAIDKIEYIANQKVN